MTANERPVPAEARLTDTELDLAVDKATTNAYRTVADAATVKALAYKEAEIEEYLEHIGLSAGRIQELETQIKVLETLLEEAKSSRSVCINCGDTAGQLWNH